MKQLALADQGVVHRTAGVCTHKGAWGCASVRLTVLFAALTGLGVVTVASVASAHYVPVELGRRLTFTGLGVVAFLAGCLVDYRLWRRHSLFFLVASVGMLMAVLLWGITLNGARRWMRIMGQMTVQPSEFAKVGLLIWLAAYCERHLAGMQSFAGGFLKPLAVVSVAALLILAEPDFGTAVLLGAVCATVLLVMGARPIFMFLAAASALPIMQRLIMAEPYRMRRILAFINPWVDPDGIGYQLIQSKIAIGSGALTGLGLGAGLQKAGFLPGTENDFIFCVIAEELGFVGSLAVVGLFALVLWESLKVACRARDPFGFALATGLSCLLGLQAAIHIAVVTGSVPTKGLSLPFISAGGSSLIASMFAAGVLVNIARCQERPDPHPTPGWQDEMPAYERVVGRLVEGIGAGCGRTARRLLPE